MNPTDRYIGRHHDERGRSASVMVNSGIPRTRCQGLDYAHGAREQDGPYRPCDHPPFAIISDGAAASASLCWRHLYVLGDTGALTVQPYLAHELQMSPAERAAREAAATAALRHREGSR